MSCNIRTHSIPLFLTRIGEVFGLDVIFLPVREASYGRDTLKKMFYLVIAALCSYLVFVWRKKQPATKRVAVGDSCFDYVIVGGGPSGLYLARLLTAKFPDRTICLVNKDGEPPAFPWKYYMVNLVGVVLPKLVPSFKYECRSTKRQFANCTYLGGSSNINAAVAPLPEVENIRTSMGEAFGDTFAQFLASEEIDFLSAPTPESKPLDRLSSDLNEAGINGGKIRMFAQGMKRIHPCDFVTVANGNVKIKIGEAVKAKITDGKVRGVVCESDDGKGTIMVEELKASRKIVLTCGAIESAILLIKSGCGPEELIKQAVGKDQVVVRNQHIGSNLQDHWVQRVKAHVPDKYKFNRLYPTILGYKHSFNNIAVGFGKLQLTGSNLFSLATATCLNPGEIIYKNGKLEPFLPIGALDRKTLEQGLKDLRGKVEALGIRLEGEVDKITPNWHLCGTLAVGKCVDNDLQVIGVDGLYVSDLSVLKSIVPMNTQFVSYFISYAFAAMEQ